ncbi:MAG: hypothetical protein Q7S34_01210 [bacterium]|nr:hypothetical protein [bacterium]
MPLDIIAIIIVLAVFFGAVLYLGKSAGISIIFSLPISIFLYSNFPYMEKLLALGKSPAQGEWLKVLIFLLFLIISYIVVRRAVSVVFSWSPIGKITEATLISIIITGLLATFLPSLINVDIITQYLPILDKLLSLPNVLFWWFAGSMLALFFILNR